ncbi:hypothetical protein PN36_16470 [Candidatus Thiomargarita nelsonii]|uniref:Serine acetyltransferase n=1 Tax=Candidatus Thiomargarita nelsonii TaxID=1003181 RepID=A0A0A6P8H2_9GAMM|nr:hypothetical protein PN36_16470 [Candidatus Thiomargarita nelsonii]
MIPKHLFAVLFRRFLKYKCLIASHVRKYLTKTAYPSVSFARGVFLNEGVYIQVTDGGILSVGKNVNIGRNTTIIVKYGQMEIDAQTHIGQNVVLVSRNHISIGEDCLIAEGVTIRDQNHGTKICSQPFRLQPFNSSPIIIENNRLVPK